MGFRSLFFVGAQKGAETVACVGGCMVSKDDKGSYVTSIKAGETWIENAWLPDSLSAPERFGYKFLGWATSEGGEVSYSTAEIVNVESGTTLYAVWVED